MSAVVAPPLLTRVLAAWKEIDTQRALHARDRDAIRSTEAARALVLELFVDGDRAPTSALRSPPPADDSFALRSPPLADDSAGRAPGTLVP